MILNINDDRYFESPTLSTLEEELQKLRPEEFAILAAGDQHYIQTCRNEDDTFVLEYRDGSPDAHFGAVEPIDDLADVVRAFSLYSLGDSQWKSLRDWHRVEFSDEDFLNHDNSYLINGEIYPKVPCGSETYTGVFVEQICPECGGSAGEFHEPGCTLEQCPRCGEANHSCDCDCE
jgi:hypothetical protein